MACTKVSPQKMKWSKLTGKPIERISEQYIPIPLAIATNDRLPRKGQKSSMIKCIESRYHQSTPPVMLNSLSTEWIPEACFLEGMFMINSVPLGTHRTFSDYTKFLIQRFIIPCFKQGSQSVHVIFDNPGRLPQTPKSCERARCDLSAPIHEGHTCDTIESQMSIPKKWSKGLIDCCTYKKSLDLTLPQWCPPKNSTKLSRTGSETGCCWEISRRPTRYVESTGVLQPDPILQNNSEETDTRVWRHVQQKTSSKCLVVSPDTDMYMIGLPLYHGGNRIFLCKSILTTREKCNTSI